MVNTGTTSVVKDFNGVILQPFAAEPGQTDPANGSFSGNVEFFKIDFNANPGPFGNTEGPHHLTVESIDMAGNITQSEDLIVTIDFTAPDASTTPDMLAASDER